MDRNTHLVLFFRGLYHYLGIRVDEALKQEILEFLIENRWPRICGLCGKRIRGKGRTIDHIIPKATCYEVGLPELCIDRRNFQVAHKECNSAKKDNLADLSPRILAKLKSLGYSST